jgi:hypothetical protein
MGNKAPIRETLKDKRDFYTVDDLLKKHSF